jgi:two-component system sensor histidine kinase YesM
MDKERLAATRAALASDAEPQRHIGLSNTNKRIMLQYGEACRSKVLSRKGLGTAVTLYFPQ